MESKEIVRVIADACDRKNAENIVVLAMDNISLVADYFLICNGNNERQVQAITKEVIGTLEEQNIDAQVEGLSEARWVIVEAEGILCHIFHHDERLYYNLEKLWGDASEVSLSIGQER